MTNLALDSAESDWVEANHHLVRWAFDAFWETGEWPPVERMQRALDQHNFASPDVIEALRHMPKLPGEMRPWEPTIVAIPLRVLRFHGEAKDVLKVCFAIVRLAIAAYTSDTDRPMVTSESPGLFEAADLPDLRVGASLAIKMANMWRRRIARAGALLSSSPASPLGSGSHVFDQWQFEVDGRMARRYRGVRTIGDYFDRQAEIMAEYARDAPEAPPPQPTRLTLFVLMPFGPEWSASVYAMTKRAAATLASTGDEIDVYRADDIVASGKITDQITRAIHTADAILADITDTNPNVMWELGFAQALGKPVVILNQDVAASPFDLHDWRQVAYDLAAIDSAEQRVTDHLRSALGITPAGEPPSK